MRTCVLLLLLFALPFSKNSKHFFSRMTPMLCLSARTTLFFSYDSYALPFSKNNKHFFSYDSYTLFLLSSDEIHALHGFVAREYFTNTFVCVCMHPYSYSTLVIFHLNQNRKVSSSLLLLLLTLVCVFFTTTSVF